MREYDVTIPATVVHGIANEIIEYLEQHPEDHVECIVTRSILDDKSRFSDKSIIDAAETLQFSDEEVNLINFLRGMSEARRKLIFDLIDIIGEPGEQHDRSSSEKDKRFKFDELVLKFEKWVPSLQDCVKMALIEGGKVIFKGIIG